MTENQVDGGQAEGTAQNANVGASPGDGVKQPSFDAAKLQQTFDAFGKQLEEITSRVNGLQSVKDKQDVKLTGLEGKIAEYENLVEKLGSKDSALAQMQLQEQLASMNQALQELRGSVSPQSAGNGASGAVNAAKTFADLGLDLKNSFVVDALGKQYSTAEEAELAAYRVQRQIQQSPNPSDTQNPAMQGSVSNLSVEALTKEYQSKMLVARGKKVEQQQIKEYYRNKGVPVDNVIFGV